MLKNIDSKYLRGWASRIRKKIKNDPLVKNKVIDKPSNEEILFDSEYRYITYYEKNNKSLLSSLCERYGSDKGEIQKVGHPYPWPAHTYADFYERQLFPNRESIKRVFECGIGTANPKFQFNMSENGRPGASLRVWRDYFFNATVYGVDIDRDVLFEEDRIKTFFIDQLNPEAIAACWDEIKVGDFDIIIDDGLHTYEAGICLFENSYHKLRSGGIYIIEDIWLRDLIKYQRYFIGKNYIVDYVCLERPDVELSDNSLVVVRKY